MKTRDGRTRPTCWPITRQNSANGRPVSADKAMPVLSFITTKTGDVRLRNTNIGRLPVLMSNRATNGAIPPTARAVTAVPIVTREQNNSSIRRYISRQNVMTFSRRGTVRGVPSVLSLTSRPVKKYLPPESCQWRARLICQPSYPMYCRLTIATLVRCPSVEQIRCLPHSRHLTN
jgi:hypothetical protein